MNTHEDRDLEEGDAGGFSEPGPSRKVPKYPWAKSDMGLSAGAIEKVFDEAQELIGITFQQKVKIVLDDVFDYVCEKNRKYGDSALHPIRVFSKADPMEQLRVRLDDKLSRIRTCEPDDLEDSVKDLIGYLVLYRIGEKEAK